jgi:hypothetical protein
MSHPGDVVWLNQHSMCDPMGEFGAEDDELTRPMPSSLSERAAVVSRVALPQTPLREASTQTPVAPPAPVAALGLLTLGQAPFVVLWALQSAKAPPAGALSGWLHAEVPVAMRITEDGRLLGTTDVDRLMLPTGDHMLELRNDDLGFAARQMVTIKAGETSILPVRLPSASISINAKPWAEAWVDGERVGDTPIGTLMRTIGRH